MGFLIQLVKKIGSRVGSRVLSVLSISGLYRILLVTRWGPVPTAILFGMIVFDNQAAITTAITSISQFTIDGVITGIGTLFTALGSSLGSSLQRVNTGLAGIAAATGVNYVSAVYNIALGLAHIVAFYRVAGLVAYVLWNDNFIPLRWYGFVTVMFVASVVLVDGTGPLHTLFGLAENIVHVGDVEQVDPTGLIAANNTTG